MYDATGELHYTLRKITINIIAQEKSFIISFFLF